jgi:hypothetical protein
MYILYRLNEYFIKRTNHEQAEVYHTFMDFLWRFYVDFVDIVKVMIVDIVKVTVANDYQSQSWTL